MCDVFGGRVGEQVGRGGWPPSSRWGWMEWNGMASPQGSGPGRAHMSCHRRATGPALGGRDVPLPGRQAERRPQRSVRSDQTREGGRGERAVVSHLIFRDVGGQKCPLRPHGTGRTVTGQAPPSPFFFSPRGSFTMYGTSGPDFVSRRTQAICTQLDGNAQAAVVYVACVW